MKYVKLPQNFKYSGTEVSGVSVPFEIRRSSGAAVSDLLRNFKS